MNTFHSAARAEKARRLAEAIIACDGCLQSARDMPAQCWDMAATVAGVLSPVSDATKEATLWLLEERETLAKMARSLRPR